MKTRKIESCVVPPLSLQEEFASYRGQAGVVSSLSRHRGPAGEDVGEREAGVVVTARRACRTIEGLFESLLSEAFNA